MLCLNIASGSIEYRIIFQMQGTGNLQKTVFLIGCQCAAINVGIPVNYALCAASWALIPIFSDNLAAVHIEISGHIKLW